jgi:hypothetical protein
VKPNDKTTISWTTPRGKKETREINCVIDIRDFRGTPGFSLLAVAANTHCSISDIEMFLDREGINLPQVMRSRGWIQRRRWLFQQPGKVNPQSDRDGKYKQACKIMAENRSLSLHNLVHLLKKQGIHRSKEWCRKHRGDAVH